MQVPTIRYDAVVETFGPFDTLLADCEGALFFILKEEPRFLDTFRTVLLENDYEYPWQKQYVDRVLQENGFSLIWSRVDGCG